jgi:hypothetical protein
LPTAWLIQNSKPSVSGRLSAPLADHLDQRGGAAHQRGLAGADVVVLGERAHEGQVDMHVRVNEAGEDVFAGGVNHRRVRWRVQVFADARDLLAFAVNVRLGLSVCGNDRAVFDQQ